MFLHPCFIEFEALHISMGFFTGLPCQNFPHGKVHNIEVSWGWRSKKVGPELSSSGVRAIFKDSGKKSAKVFLYKQKACQNNTLFFELVFSVRWIALVKVFKIISWKHRCININTTSEWISPHLGWYLVIFSIGWNWSNTGKNEKNVLICSAYKGNILNADKIKLLFNLHCPGDFFYFSLIFFSSVGRYHLLNSSRLEELYSYNDAAVHFTFFIIGQDNFWRSILVNKFEFSFFDCFRNTNLENMYLCLCW